MKKSRLGLRHSATAAFAVVLPVFTTSLLGIGGDALAKGALKFRCSEFPCSRVSTKIELRGERYSVINRGEAHDSDTYFQAVGSYGVRQHRTRKNGAAKRRFFLDWSSTEGDYQRYEEARAFEFVDSNTLS